MSSAAPAPAPHPTTPVVLRTAFHVEEEKQKRAFQDGVFYSPFLMGTRQSISSLFALQAFPHLLALIFDYARPCPPDEGQFYYKMGLRMCLGTEHVHMEALEQPAALQRGGLAVGVLMNQPIASPVYAGLLIPFLKEYAWKKNDDDDDDDDDDGSSWWNEGQLRAAWKEFAVSRYCEAPEGRCKGLCCALPGDSIVWRLADYGYPLSTSIWKPASQASLIERGFVVPSKGITAMGMLYQHAKLAREDPSQLETNDDDDEAGDDDGEVEDADDVDDVDDVDEDDEMLEEDKGM